MGASESTKNFEIIRKEFLQFHRKLRTFEHDQYGEITVYQRFRDQNLILVKERWINTAVEAEKCLSDIKIFERVPECCVIPLCYR